MAALNDLINQITDTELRDRIQREVDRLAKQKSSVWSLRSIFPNALRSMICLSKPVAR